MTLTDVTREAVLKAVDEFDEIGRHAFLSKYGFGEAREYWLVHEGHRYDSKAIVGAAHAHLGDSYRPLQPGEFSGGAATVGRVLEDLGFEVEADTDVIVCEGYEIDLDALYREMWSRADPQSDGTRLFVGSGATPRNRPIKRLLNDLFGVPVEDEYDAVNHACRTAASAGLYERGWAEKVDRHGEPQGPVYRSFTYRLYRQIGSDSADGSGEDDVRVILRRVLEEGDRQDVEFVRGHHVPDELLARLARVTHLYAWEHGEHRDDGDRRWRSYAGGIEGWWKDAADLTDEQFYRLHRFRSDVVARLEEQGVAERDHPRSVVLRVEAPEGTSRSNPSWDRDEVVLALDLYVQAGCLNGNRLLGKTSPEVVELSERMASLPIHPTSDRADGFRNPTGVALKLANFRAIERDVRTERGQLGAEDLPKGMASYSALDRAVFEEYFEQDFEGLHEEAQSILAVTTPNPAPPRPTATPTAQDRPVEAVNVETYEASASKGGMRSRSEHVLVESFKHWMENERGYTVVSRSYDVPGVARPLLADLYVKELDLLVEAKNSDHRSKARMAVGQLLDYRRFEKPAPNLAVLFPYEPSDDIKRYLRSVGAGWIWPKRTKPGFNDSTGGGFS